PGFITIAREPSSRNRTPRPTPLGSVLVVAPMIWSESTDCKVIPIPEETRSPRALTVTRTCWSASAVTTAKTAATMIIHTHHEMGIIMTTYPTQDVVTIACAHSARRGLTFSGTVRDQTRRSPTLIFSSSTFALSVG